MNAFTITAKNEVRRFTTGQEAPAGGVVFGSAEELSAAVGQWPAARLAEIWNQLPGAKPLTKFTDRKTAVRRLWEALAAEMPDSGQQRRKVGSKPQAVAAVAKPSKQGQTAGKGTKTEQILALLRQPSGATLDSLMRATEWQAHSVRGFISGQLGKRLGLLPPRWRTGVSPARVNLSGCYDGREVRRLLHLRGLARSIPGSSQILIGRLNSIPFEGLLLFSGLPLHPLFLGGFQCHAHKLRQRFLRPRCRSLLCGVLLNQLSHLLHALHPRFGLFRCDFAAAHLLQRMFTDAQQTFHGLHLSYPGTFGPAIQQALEQPHRKTERTEVSLQSLPDTEGDQRYFRLLQKLLHRGLALRLPFGRPRPIWLPFSNGRPRTFMPPSPVRSPRLDGFAHSLRQNSVRLQRAELVGPSSFPISVGSRRNTWHRFRWHRLAARFTLRPVTWNPSRQMDPAPDPPYGCCW
jgi:Protein of unknown function (DUF3489)